MRMAADHKRIFAEGIRLMRGKYSILAGDRGDIVF
jgi:hypothetical protein